MNSNIPTNSSNDDVKDWSSLLLGFRVVHWILMTSTIWIVISLIGHGTKKGRWKTSAATTCWENGPVFITSVALAVTLFLRLIVASVMFELPRSAIDVDKCELFGDITVMINTTFYLLLVVFFWFRQIFIFRNPQVIGQVGKLTTVITLALLVLVTVAAFTFAVLHILPPSKQSIDHVCFESEEMKTSAMYLILMIITLIIILGMCCYTVFVVKSIRPDSTTVSERVTDDSTVDTESRASKYIRKVFALFIKGNEPVHQATRRTMWSSVVIIIVCSLGPILFSFTLFKSFPTVVQITTTNILFLICTVTILRVFSYFSTLMKYPISSLELKICS